MEAANSKMELRMRVALEKISRLVSVTSVSFSKVISECWHCMASSVPEVYSSPLSCSTEATCLRSWAARCKEGAKLFTALPRVSRKVSPVWTKSPERCLDSSSKASTVDSRKLMNLVFSRTSAARAAISCMALYWRISSHQMWGYMVEWASSARGAAPWSFAWIGASGVANSTRLARWFLHTSGAAQCRPYHPESPSVSAFPARRTARSVRTSGGPWAGSLDTFQLLRWSCSAAETS
mmetsp:Transcript_59668/g.159666  ORF Transcript_59668/g.159666 Transcript_59668/m.159666 type:complete len:237 (+) Transcript_59668:5109-5819(+)